jgi:hypothetical protein
MFDMNANYAVIAQPSGQFAVVQTITETANMSPFLGPLTIQALESVFDTRVAAEERLRQLAKLRLSEL